MKYCEGCGAEYGHNNCTCKLVEPSGKKTGRPAGPELTTTSIKLPLETLERARKKHAKLHAMVVAYITKLSNDGEES